MVWGVRRSVLVADPGVALPKSRPPGLGGHAGRDSRPRLPTRIRLLCCGVKDELAIDRVADPSFEAPDGFFDGLAFGSLALVKDAAGALGLTQLSHCCHVQGVVELPVAGEVDAGSGFTAAAALDGCAAVVAGEVMPVGEPGDVVDFLRALSR
jgi:hypothetical protein